MTITTFDEPRDIVEELYEMHDQTTQIDPLNLGTDSIYKRAADEIVRLRKVLGITSN